MKKLPSMWREDKWLRKCRARQKGQAVTSWICLIFGGLCLALTFAAIPFIVFAAIFLTLGFVFRRYAKNTGRHLEGYYGWTDEQLRAFGKGGGTKTLWDQVRTFAYKRPLLPEPDEPPEAVTIPSVGRDYEFYVARRLANEGWLNVQVTRASGDYGVDVVATDPHGRRTAFQCKYYSSPVGVDAVQEVHAGMTMYDCSCAVVCTNNTFTPAAQQLAQRNGVALWPRYAGETIHDELETMWDLDEYN